ncbi:two-component system response regulator YesN [Paenibacillus taihuensis]|uniref:Two-component system response regulator YesN n=1 Tax=Paenibacillus taihuensis TaxID=1156355 RepID=A0A3D9SCV3_9BACL|nr:helix-turn-helix domain-containing protein [Paenibacillus taihuensis]REE92709.1 two-component system response regulator YesN [Paenibacillus taihuensis]
MFKMMIVDDEPLVRLALHQMVDWDKLGIRIVCEAGNGEDALLLLEQMPDIDIMLMDIEMPRMNGIELLRTVAGSGRSRQLATVVLSAYNNYSYVREAFLLGAVDYVVKTNMDEEHITPVFTKVVETMSRASKDMTISIPADHSEANAIPGKERDAIIQMLLSGDEEQERLAFGHLSADDLLKSGFHQMVLVLRTSGNAELPDRSGLIKQTMRTILASMSITSEIYYKGNNEYVLLCSFSDDRSSLSISGKIHSFFATVKTRLKEYANVSAAMSGSGLGIGKKQSWYKLYRQASCAIMKLYYEGYGTFLEYDRTMEQASKLEIRNKALFDQLESLRKALSEAMQQVGETNLLDILARIKQLLSTTRVADPEQIMAWFVDIIWQTGGMLYARGIRWSQIQGYVQDPVESMKQLETLDQTMGWLQALLLNVHRTLQQGLKESSKPVYSILVTKVKKFLEEHYRDDISQSAVSEVVGVSETYISKQFSKEVGCSFMHYLTQLRIEEAKKLLKSGYKIAEVSEKVGYSNHEHFSRIFKKITGINPKTYRESI